MTKLFYTRLALTNIRKNGKTYFPYIAASVGIVAMFYIAQFLELDPSVIAAADSGTVQIVLGLGVWVAGIFSAIFLFYTNSFLIKRRKKEFGLYSILGMEKKHISRVLSVETLIVSVGSIVGGIVLGIFFSKLMLILLFSLLHLPVPIGFSISILSLINTVCLFGAIFASILLWNMLQIQRSNPIELLKGGNVGEREPKTRWFTATVGLVTVGIGYYIAITTQSPLQAIPLFFAAAILVMIGTYCLFSAGSILLLKLLRKNKAYYYQPSHFYSISGMIYRMKQNAVGLANICILSVGVMVMVSTTLSLYMGGNDVIRTAYPSDVTVNISPQEVMDYSAIDELIESELAAAGIEPQNGGSFAAIQMEAVHTDGSFAAASAEYYMLDGYMLDVMDQEEYYRLTGERLNLVPGEVVYHNGNDKTQRMSINVYGSTFAVKQQPESSPIARHKNPGSLNRCLIVTDSIDTNLMLLEKVHAGSGYLESKIFYEYSFDTDESVNPEHEKEFVYTLRTKMRELGASGDAGQRFTCLIDSVETARNSFFSLYGGLLFLGIFLGTLFILATVLIIYYKQVSEGYDDRQRFRIMQQVGMDRWEVKQVIRSQVLTVFMLPIAVAVIHLAVAFPVLTKLLAVLNLYNIPLFAAWTVITVLVFAVLYTVVYALTAKTYYKIVQ